MKVLYISHDGITDHIGQSQIAPYLLGISKSKVSVFILSVEKKINKDLIASFKSLFNKNKISWSYYYYSNALSFLSFFLEIILLSINSYKIIKNASEMLDDISNWYVRRSRRRFWKSENDDDKIMAYSTLYYVLLKYIKIL